MEAQDFEMPSPKRQRTASPVEAQPAPAQDRTSSQEAVVSQAQTDDPVQSTPATINGLPIPDGAGSGDMLDVLMQHVETEAGSSRAADSGIAEAAPMAGDMAANSATEQTRDVNMTEVTAAPVEAINSTWQEQTSTAQEADVPPAGSVNVPQHDQSFPPGLEATEKPALDHLQEVAKANSLPPTADTLVQSELPPAPADPTIPQTAPEGREWETDSSPVESDSSDTSSDSSSDSSSDDDPEEDGEEYTLLDPYEQARILMAEDGGGGGGGAGGDSDDDGSSRPARVNAGAGLRTTNEKADDILPKPDVTVTETMPIELLGTVEATVETTVLVKAATSGSYQVLESGSVLCLQDRRVIGAVHETLGRVEQPLYTVRFASASDIQESGVTEKGTKIFYVKDHSTFVFTQPLKAYKGSDASNFHDEEVGDDEMEFSDDEAEAEHKRQMKLRRKGIDPATMPAPSRGGRGQGQRGGRGGGSGRGGTYMSSIPESDTTSAYGNGSLEMNYDDVEEGETEYTPLKRPETLPNGSSQLSPPSQTSYSPQPQRGGYQHNENRGHGRGRGRGNDRDRGRGRGRGNDRGRGRAGNRDNDNNKHAYNNNSNNNTTNFNAYNNAYNQSSSTSVYSQQSQQNPPQFFPSNPQQQAYFGFQAPPPPPQLTPSSGPYSNGNGNTVPPSPMTPLAGGSNFTFQAPSQSQYQNQWQQYHQNQNQQYQAHQQQYGAQNADAIAQVQRQLEELRRQTQGGGWPAQQ